jgi:hypothetical protein
VATYISNKLLKSSSYITNPTSSPNTLSITLYIKDSPIQIHNIYNTPWKSSALLAQEMFIFSTLPTLVLGDYNLHSPSADPLRLFSHEELCLSNPILDVAYDRGFSLLNTPGIHTFFPHDHTKCPSTLDLAFTNIPFSKCHSCWNNDTPPTGSDHSSPCNCIFLNFTIPPFTLPN